MSSCRPRHPRLPAARQGLVPAATSWPRRASGPKGATLSDHIQHGQLRAALPQDAPLNLLSTRPARVEKAVVKQQQTAPVTSLGGESAKRRGPSPPVCPKACGPWRLPSKNDDSEGEVKTRAPGARVGGREVSSALRHPLPYRAVGSPRPPLHLQFTEHLLLCAGLDTASLTPQNNRNHTTVNEDQLD